MKSSIKKYIIFTILLLINALYFNMATLPYKLVTGDILGLSIVLKDTLNFNPLHFLIITYLVIVLLSFIVLDAKHSISVLYASIMLPILIKITSNVPTLIDLGVDDKLLVTIIIGLLSGLVIGGSDLLGLGLGGVFKIGNILEETFKISSGKVRTYINSLIVLLGAKYSILNLVYGILIITISSEIATRIKHGISKHKIFLIVTDEDDLIINYLNTSKIGVTILEAQGGYSNKKDQVLLSAIPTAKYIEVREHINKIDKKAFIVSIDSYSVNGGFLNKKVGS